jgi:hypothetical protein
LIIFGTLALTLIIFLVARNQKDKNKLEDDLKNDYQKPKDEEDDAEIDNVLK